jgi:hypothetical protein
VRMIEQNCIHIAQSLFQPSRRSGLTQNIDSRDRSHAKIKSKIKVFGLTAAFGSCGREW